MRLVCLSEFAGQYQSFANLVLEDIEVTEIISPGFSGTPLPGTVQQAAQAIVDTTQLSRKTDQAIVIVADGITCVPGLHAAKLIATMALGPDNEQKSKMVAIAPVITTDPASISNYPLLMTAVSQHLYAERNLIAYGRYLRFGLQSNEALDAGSTLVIHPRTGDHIETPTSPLILEPGLVALRVYNWLTDNNFMNQRPRIKELEAQNEMEWNIHKRVRSYLPQRFPIDTIDSNYPNETKRAGYETITKADMPQHVMAGIAASQAMEKSSHCAEKLSAIVLAMLTTSTEHAAPVCYVQRILGQSEAIAFELNATSDGGVTAIEVVARILSSDPRMDVGLVTSTMRYPDGMDRWLAGALFGDGAAAAVISKKSGFARLIVSQRTSNPEFEMLLRLRMKSPGVWDFSDLDLSFGPYVETITQEVQAAISATLREANITIEDISIFASLRFPSSACKRYILSGITFPSKKLAGPSCVRMDTLVRATKSRYCPPARNRSTRTRTARTGSWRGIGFRMTCLLLQIE